MTDLLIAGAHLADGERSDLGVAGGRLVDPSELSSPERIDADGLLALPGLVDSHTHLREPGREDAETIATGTLALAAFWAYTLVLGGRAVAVGETGDLDPDRAGYAVATAG